MRAIIADADPRIVVKENKTEGILNYDLDNAYPQRVERVVSWSGSAQSCLRLYSRFLVGGGVKDETFYKAVINRDGLTVDKLLRRMANDLARCRGVALQVNFNALGEVVEVNPVKFKDVRIKSDKTKAAIYDDWGRERKKTIKKDEIKEIDWWNPDIDIINQQVENAEGWESYRGQIYYWTPEGRDYPSPIYDAQLEDMETEGELQRFRNRTVKTNFTASHIAKVYKSEQQMSQDGDPEEYEDDDTDIVDTFREFQGTEDPSSLMVVELDNPEDMFELEKLELQDYDGFYETTEKSVKESIVEAFMIPKILLLRGEAALGDSKQFEQAKDAYNDFTSDDRLVLEEILRDIFSRWVKGMDGGVINPTEDYSIIPIRVIKEIGKDYFPYFSKNEIRESLNYAPVEEPKADTKLLVEVLGVDGTQALIAVLTNPDLNDEQKMGSLEVVFGLSKEQAEKILVLNPANIQIPER